MGVVFFCAGRWSRRLGLVLVIIAGIWMGLFPFYWSEWFNTRRAVRGFGELRHFLGVTAAFLPIVSAITGCLRLKGKAK